MKNFIIVALTALFITGCASEAESVPTDVVLTFKVSDPISQEIVILSDTDVRTFALDANGTCEAVYTSSDASYARVVYGRSEKKIYMEAGDRATISFDAKDFSGTFKFEGPKASAVEYLNNVVLTALPDGDYALPFDEYVQKLQAKEKAALKLLHDSSIEGAGNFIEMEEGRIRYAYATPLLMYPVGHMLLTQNLEYEPDEAYFACIEKYFNADQDLVNLSEYRNFIIEAAHVLDAENRNVSEINPKTVAQMRYIADRFDNSEVVENLLHYLASSYVDTFGIDGIAEMESIYKTYVKDESLLADYAVKYDKWNRSKPGKLSPDFDAVDVDGRKWSLSDFRGKYVYIDMWATWCAPCKRELPHLKVLEERFRDAQIVFVGLSIDGQKENWEKMVRSGEMCGIQLYVGPRSSFQQAYNIAGIPRFILLDKEGRIISNDMSRPSAEETVSVLESLEGIR